MNTRIDVLRYRMASHEQRAEVDHYLADALGLDPLPARRSAILRYDGDAATLEAQAAAIRQRVQAAVPALDVLLVADRWSVIYPPTNDHEGPRSQ